MQFILKLKMKTIIALTILAVLGTAWADEEELKLADICDEEKCQLPDCRCSSTTIPGGLSARDTPQFVTITFDDAVTVTNIETYRRILYNRHNKNGCPAGVTFYVNHEYTNYQIINELYNNQFEIALHSISHQTPMTYWYQATYETMKQEFADQRIQMAHFANIPIESIRGLRKPFLQLAGNHTFHVIKNHGLTYDCSWPSISFINPGLWPYTLDYASIQDCPIPPCPTAALPGVWVQPMVGWVDLNGVGCSMVDGCFWVPDLDDADAWYNFILTNFERHYLNNRAPFGFYVHEWYISAYPAVGEALGRFLDLINNLDSVFMVNSIDVLEWVKNPVPLNEYKEKSCKSFSPRNCPATTCGPLTGAHNNMDYYMPICNTCPRTYPWLGNPLGQ